MKNLEVKERPPLVKNSGVSRRSFLGYSGASAAALGLFMVGCDDDDDGPTPSGDNGVNLGSGDIGILNYAYALEQLEAAFYLQIQETPYANMGSEEGQILEDLQKHEEIHRDFFKAALGADAIEPLMVDFSSIDFSDRASVLGAAKTFEDLGVAAYNGAGKFIQDASYLVIAGKIVSVEARHAAAIRDLINPLSKDFAGDDVIDSNGLGRALGFNDVLTAASKYLKTKVDGSNLPK